MLDWLLAPIKPYIRSITLAVVISLLAATLVLGSLLKASYGANGELKQQLKASEDAVVTVSTQLTQKQQSCDVTDALLAESRRNREVADTNTTKLIKDLKGIVNEKRNEGNVGGVANSPLIRVLDAASCQASNDGVPCSP